MSTLQETPFRHRAFLKAAILLGLSVCVLLQGSRGIMESTEGRYSECARETIASNNPLEPVLNGEHHWTKPPLTYWAIGAGTLIFGNNPWGARAYLILAFLLTVFAVHVLDAALWKRPSSGLSALVFATSPFAIATANIIATDALLTLWEAWAFAFYWLAVRSGKRRYTTLMWLALALAVATKGPVGLLPLTAIIPAQLLLRRRGDLPRGLITLEGLAIFAVVGLSWYIYVVWRYPDVLQDWIEVEIVGRLGYDAHHRLSSQPYKVFTRYFPIMIFGTGPWLLWLLWSQRVLLQSSSIRALCLQSPQRVEQLFLLLAIALQFLLFAFSTSRMPLYLAPLFVPMAIAVGRGLDRLYEHGMLARSTLLRVACATALVMVGAKAIAARQSTWKDMSDIAKVLQRVSGISDGTPVAALFRAPLNGLEFHLGRRIPTVSILGEPTLAGRRHNSDAAAPSVVGVVNTQLLPSMPDGELYLPGNSFVVVRNKDLAAFGRSFASLGFASVAASDHWTVLRAAAPVTISVAGMTRFPDTAQEISLAHKAFPAPPLQGS